MYSWWEGCAICCVNNGVTTNLHHFCSILLMTGTIFTCYNKRRKHIPHPHVILIRHVALNLSAEVDIKAESGPFYGTWVKQFKCTIHTQDTNYQFETTMANPIPPQGNHWQWKQLCWGKMITKEDFILCVHHSHNVILTCCHGILVDILSTTKLQCWSIISPCLLSSHC